VLLERGCDALATQCEPPPGAGGPRIRSELTLGIDARTSVDPGWIPSGWWLDQVEHARLRKRGG